MTLSISALPVGNALSVRFRPAPSCSRYRLLRNETGQFGGPDDDDAVIVVDGANIDDEIRSIVDDAALSNGQLYHYALYGLFTDGWVESDAGTGVPLASYVDRSVDSFSVVRERIDAGLAVECERGTLVHEDGRIPVLTAPPVFEDTTWPVVTVHLQSETPSGRGIGEIIEPDEEDGSDWRESEGWLSRTQLAVIGWTTNPDERIELRKAIRRLVIANLPVFEGNGMSEIEVSMQDIEDMESYSSPVYQAVCTIVCLAPAIVSGKVGRISDVVTSVSTEI